jgi:hypothetical protein
MRKEGKTDDSVTASKPAAHAPQHTRSSPSTHERENEHLFHETTNTTLLTLQTMLTRQPHPQSGGPRNTHHEQARSTRPGTRTRMPSPLPGGRNSTHPPQASLQHGDMNARKRRRLAQFPMYPGHTEPVRMRLTSPPDKHPESLTIHHRKQRRREEDNEAQPSAEA